MFLLWESEHSILTPSPIRYSPLPQPSLPPCFLPPEEAEEVVAALAEEVLPEEGSEEAAAEAGEDIKKT
jgi:hypothetical protein